jgi:Trypsin-like peptidase domain
MWIRAALMLVWLVAAPDLGRAAGADDSLLAYSVGVNGGAGVYLGQGLVLSVAHIVGGGIVNRPNVTVAGQTLIATVVKESPFERLDLALLEIDEQHLPVSLRLRRIALCQGSPWPGEEVVSLSAQGPVRSRVLSPKGLPAGVKRFSTVIRDVATTGNSGSGLFDAQGKCLLGIMSRKISQVRLQEDTGTRTTVDVAKYFVPASTIADFMPGRIHLKFESISSVQFSFR